MDKHQKEIDLFDQYIAGALDREMKEEMEKRLSSDLEFKANFEEYKLITDGIKYSGRKKLHEKVKTWDKELLELPNNNLTTRNRFIKWYAIAAVLTFFIIASGIIYSSLSTNYDSMVAQYYQPYKYIPETTRGEKIDQNPIELVFILYDRGEFQQVIQKINQLDAAQRTIVSDYILANAYQAIEKIDDAIPLYKKIADSENAYTTGSKWYLALCYLSKNNLSEATPLLEQLKETKTSYAPKAKMLLDELSK